MSLLKYFSLRNLFTPSKTEEQPEIFYQTKLCTELSDAELSECSKLYSEHYGLWGDGSNKKGERIKYPPKYFSDLAKKQDRYVSLAKINGNIIGQAFYIRKKISTGEYVSWVMQLVVHSDYRRKGIARKLLLSIWGFSGDRAWGLATANPYTVKTLESATFRKCSPSTISKNIKIIQEIAREIPWVYDIEANVDSSLVDSQFFIDTSDVPKMLSRYGSTWSLGNLKPGYEWLAFTFQGQDLNISDDALQEFLSHSDKILQDAYSRMDMKNHSWTHHAKSEVDFIENYIGKDKLGKILDIGCGQGRHSIEFAQRGYSVLGVDFSESHISSAKRSCPMELLDGACKFEKIDFRRVSFDGQFDTCLCLFDVVGSFPDKEDNALIIKNCHKSLRKGGHIVLSVMNMELTMNIAKHKGSIKQDPKKFIKMKPSKTMMTTGDIFNPEFFFWDTETNLIYRKEQFENDGFLSAEYIIRDKRYTMNEISDALCKAGFKIILNKFIGAGKFDASLKPTDLKAKEILIIAQK